MENKNKIQQEIVNSLSCPSHGLLLLSPRFGKTKLTIDILKKENPKSVLWVTPSTKLRDEDIPNEFKTWNAEDLLEKTHIVCYASLQNCCGDFDKIILDEYQDITENNLKRLFDGNIKYKSILGLSGTHPKHDEKTDLLKRLNLEIIYQMSIDEAVEKNLVAPYNIKVIYLPLDNKNKNVKAGNKEKPFYQTEEDNYAYLTACIERAYLRDRRVPKYMYLNRMRFIYNLKSKNEFAKNYVNKVLKGRTLIFAGSIANAEFICENVYHSKTNDKKLQEFIDGKIDKLACVNAGGVGFTYKNVDNFVIVQTNTDKKGDTTQKIARSLVHQNGYKANIIILAVKNTVDESWVKNTLMGFKEDNIEEIYCYNPKKYIESKSKENE